MRSEISCASRALRVPIGPRLAALVPLILLFLIGCGDSSSLPAERDADSGGRAGDLRIACLSPGLAVTLREIGLGDRIVGRHGFDSVTAASVPAVGDEQGIDYESLLEVRPTHVLLERSQRGVPPRLREIAATRRWDVREIPLLTLADIENAIDTLAALDPENVTARAADVAAGFRRALVLDPEIRDRLGATLLMTWSDPIGVMGPGSFHHDLLGRLGAAPRPESGNAYITLAVEDVLALDPHSIVLLSPGADDTDARRLLGPLADAGLDAVDAGRVVVVGDELALLPAPTLARVADEIRAGIASWSPSTEHAPPGPSE